MVAIRSLMTSACLVSWGEAGDVADRVLVQVGLELLLEPGQVVAGQPLVQLAVSVRGFHRRVQLRGLHRVLTPEFAHQGDDLVAQGRTSHGAAVDDRADLRVRGHLRLAAALSIGWWLVLEPLEQAGDRGELRTGRFAARLAQRRGRLLAAPPGPGDLVVEAAESLLDLAVGSVGDADLIPHRFQLAVQPGQFGRRRLELAFFRPELLGPVDHGLPVEVGELAGLVQAAST